VRGGKEGRDLCTVMEAGGAYLLRASGSSSCFFFVFFHEFRRSDEIFENFRENSRGVGVSTVSGTSAAVGITVVAYVIAVTCGLRACC
jgi:hypothetical protein